MSRWRNLARLTLRIVAALVVAVLALAVVAAGVLRTDWAHERMRLLVLSQAHRWLTATLDIARIEGSLLSGIELRGVALTADGVKVVDIERVAVSYNLRQLYTDGTVIDSITLDRPRITAQQQPDGRWNLASLVKREAPSGPSSGGRHVRINSLVVRDGAVSLRTPVTLGIAHVPTEMSALNTSLSFETKPGAWTVGVNSLSFVGAAPTLTVQRIEGAIDGGSDGWTLRSLRVVTDRSEVLTNGRVTRRDGASDLDFTASAARFDFQEWGGVITALSSMAVRSAFDVRLTGQMTAMQTNIALRSNAGDIAADVLFDTTRPGWHGKGTANVQRLDLAPWLGKPDRPSDISGRIDFDLDLITPRKFPRGSFAFSGTHAAYLDYESDDVVTTGVITDTDVRINGGTATAYGSNVRLRNSSIALDAPYPFTFKGQALGVDLRLVPANVPVPHVSSALNFDFDVNGQFAESFIRGSASFAESTFLDATLGNGSTGSIDTHVTPFRYIGEGDLRAVDLNHFGRELHLDWLADARYDGILSGRFSVDGAGADAASMTMRTSGRIERATMFGGTLTDADVAATIGDGTLEARFDGRMDDVDPALASGLALYRARLSGTGRGTLRVKDLLVRTATLNDYTLDATLSVQDSTVRGVPIQRGEVAAALSDGSLKLASLKVAGPALDADATGTIELDGVRGSNLTYHVARGDLSKLEAIIGAGFAGNIATRGAMTGPVDRPRLNGTGTGQRVVYGNVELSTGAVQYNVSLDTESFDRARGTLTLQLSNLSAGGQVATALSGTVDYSAGYVNAVVDVTRPRGQAVHMDAELTVQPSTRIVDIAGLSLSTETLAWQLAATSRPHIAWTDNIVSIDGFDLVDSSSRQQHFTAQGTWGDSGREQLHLTARTVSVDTLALAFGSRVSYAGQLNGTATVSGTREHPSVAADFAVTDGRVQRLSYEKFGGHVDYGERVAHVDVRLDQGPDVWLTAVGELPLGAAAEAAAESPLHVAVRSSRLDLALLDGLTNVVQDVQGRAELDVTVIGTTRNPQFSGRVDVENASFQVRASGARYRNGKVALRLSSDRVVVDTLRVDDEDGHSLDVSGSLGTRALRVGDLRVNVNARGFEVLRNDFGRVAVDAQLNLAGEFESPRLAGRITITGGSVAVDRVLDRTLFQLYSTTSSSSLPIDAIAALNPWERMGMDIELHIPGSLRMTGDNVQVSPGTPLGLGNINLKVFGDLYLYKDPAQPLYVNGSLDSLTGTYSFQGRRFELDPDSSVYFRGDMNPDLYVTVNRLISGVETRVSILGPLQQPELRLASTPSLDPSDILSLIVFNTSTNELSTLQQQQLAVRAGTLAAGFIAAPMVSALERTLGIDTLEIEPGADIRGGPRVTVGDEIAPGLIARFSRQFGPSEYDEATLEYYLSRIFRIRATFSDASSLSVSPFRRVERAGIDLLLFFSF